MSTAMMTSAPISRITSTGRLLATPPSTRVRPLHSTGEKMAGTAMLARIASASEPLSRTTAAPVLASVAIARNGIDNASKSSIVATGTVSPARMLVIFCPSMKPFGRAILQFFT